MAEFDGIPRRLRNGDWGVMVQSEGVAPGDSVRVVRRLGDQFTTVVTRVLWSGDGKSLIKGQRPRALAGKSGPSTSVYSPEPAAPAARPMAPPVGDRSDKPDWVKNW